ncbi:transcription factor S-II, central domain-containing protein [Chytridium lagenaria]|nr:transcription factor S-II, central domain-containing protein [Chytridium lagenaria]
MNEEQIVEHVRQIEKAIKDKDVQLVVAVLKQFNSWRPTAESLKKTSLGICMNNLRKHANSNDEIKNMAKGLITKWKEDLLKSSQPISEKKPHPKVTIERTNSLPNSPAPSTPTPITPSMKERNYKLDKIMAKSVGDKVRDKTVELLYAAIGLGSDDASSLILMKATEVESALFNEYNGVTDKYKSQFRTLVANLKDKENPKLRENVLNGTLVSVAIVTMTAEELMSDEMRRAAEEARRINMQHSMTAPPQEAETDAFKCGKCHQRKCTYYQKQTRSADEPMTTFVRCTNCGNKWKFC